MNDLCDADTVFFCEMRNILGMKFDTLKMTVGNFDFWNEAKLKKDYLVYSKLRQFYARLPDIASQKAFLWFRKLCRLPYCSADLK